jgi:hypothetical protein
MKATDLKEVVIPSVGVRYSAVENNVEVYGSDSIGWKVWVTEGNRSECINPKHIDGSIAKYVSSSLAISKANRYILRKNNNL